jgi:hypothetical protein
LPPLFFARFADARLLLPRRLIFAFSMPMPRYFCRFAPFYDAVICRIRSLFCRYAISVCSPPDATPLRLSSPFVADFHDFATLPPSLLSFHYAFQPFIADVSLLRFTLPLPFRFRQSALADADAAIYADVSLILLLAGAAKAAGSASRRAARGVTLRQRATREVYACVPPRCLVLPRCCCYCLF